MKNTDSVKGNEVSEGASSVAGSVDTAEENADAAAEPQIVPEVVVGQGNERESEPYTPGEIVEPKANWPVFLLSALGIAIIVAWATIAPNNAYNTLGATTGVDRQQPGLVLHSHRNNLCGFRARRRAFAGRGNPPRPGPRPARISSVLLVGNALRGRHRCGPHVLRRC